MMLTPEQTDILRNHPDWNLRMPEPMFSWLFKRALDDADIDMSVREWATERAHQLQDESRTWSESIRAAYMELFTYEDNVVALRVTEELPLAA